MAFLLTQLGPVASAGLQGSRRASSALSQVPVRQPACATATHGSHSCFRRGITAPLGARRGATVSRAGRIQHLTTNVATGAPPSLEAYRKLQVPRAVYSRWTVGCRRERGLSLLAGPITCTFLQVVGSTRLTRSNPPPQPRYPTHHQNGSDVRGVALAGIPKQDVNLTPLR